MGFVCGWERAGPPAISARLGISAGRDRASQEASRFNSRSNSRCTGGWWVHGSKRGPPLFRLLNGFDYRFGRCEVVAKTWHCHGAAKAASEVKWKRERGPAALSLFVTRNQPASGEPDADCVCWSPALPRGRACGRLPAGELHAPKRKN